MEGKGRSRNREACCFFSVRYNSLSEFSWYSHYFFFLANVFRLSFRVVINEIVTNKVRESWFAPNLTLSLSFCSEFHRSRESRCFEF